MPVILSKNADNQLISEFKEVILVDKTASVYDAVSCHPDIYYCRLPNGEVIKARPDEIGERYPYNIGFNAVCLEKYFIHNILTLEKNSCIMRVLSTLRATARQCPFFHYFRR